MVKIFPSLHDLSIAAAEHIVHHAQLAIKQEGEFSMAVSGGATPRLLYTQLANLPYRDQILWPKVHIFWSDERCVPPDHEDSNYKLVNDTLLSAINIPAENINRMRGEIRPEIAAKEYEDILLRFFDGKNAQLDFVLLGMGGDGHTASLFPNTSAVDETDRLVAAPFVDKFQTHRITLTLPVLNRARNVAFLVSGAKKASMLKLVLARTDDPPKYPAQRVQPNAGNLIWFIDEAAASKLPKHLIKE